jgi:hypothetical protein
MLPRFLRVRALLLIVVLHLLLLAVRLLSALFGLVGRLILRTLVRLSLWDLFRHGGLLCDSNCQSGRKGEVANHVPPLISLSPLSVMQLRRNVLLPRLVALERECMMPIEANRNDA